MQDAPLKPDDKDTRARVQLRIDPLVWDEMRMQALREHISAEKLAEKAFKRLLDMPS